MIFVSCATKNVGKYCSGGHPEDERFGYVGVGRLVCGSIPEPWARTDNRNNLSLRYRIRSYRSAAAMVVQILGFQFSDADFSFHASHSARRSSSINTLDR